MATGIKPVDYEAFLINSAEDEDLAKQLWENLKGRGYRITQHQDPDGPFQLHRDRPVYENMRDAIENSGKLLVLFTKDALTSGYVSLEMILGIEKSLQTRRMGLYLLIVGSNDLGYMTNEEVDSRKHGLLGVVPHLNVNLDQADWAERLLINLRGTFNLYF